MTGGSAIALAPYYRRFDLPWEGDAAASRRFRQCAGWGLGLFMLFALVVQFVRLPAPAADTLQVPERLARLMTQERPKPPPPPPPVVEQPQPVEQPRAVPTPQPEQRQQQARRRAEAQLASVRDELASIREALADEPAPARNLSGAVGADSRAERSLITSRAATGSSGVATASSSRGFGSGAGTLAGHDAGTVQSGVAAAAATAASVTRGASGKGGRSAEEIEQEFDRNKGAIYALYIRALREQADLSGKVVLEFTIAPEGNVTGCSVLSSELNNPELESRICARVRGIRFPARDVAAITTKKPIDFFPQG